MRRVLVIGSGGIKVAEAAEFDYSGSQALKALREEGVETVLVNPNAATIQTSNRLADKVYLLPIDVGYVARVIELERPDGILLGFGGQSALTVGVRLWELGVLDRYGVRVLGTPIEGVKTALSRSLFRDSMRRVGLPVPPSVSARSVDEAVNAVREIGLPVIVRVSFNLGGRGSFIASDMSDFKERIGKAFAHSGVREVLVERYLGGWREVEFEVVRDYWDNVAAVACLENADPMGVHTGDSVVVAPCQTLTDREYQALRRASIEVARAIGLVGECNVQLALDRRSEEYYVIETNPRMSRSSALASKATGYPLAYVAAKLAIGYKLYEIKNRITGATCSCFEPSLDYVVVKMPRWDNDKLGSRERGLGSEMMSVGEVMAIGRNLAEAYQKAVRMLDIGEPGLVAGPGYESPEPLPRVLERLRSREPYWPVLAARALRLGASVEIVSEASGVDPYFIYPIKEVVELAEEIRRLGANVLREREKLEEAKRMGFSDQQIAILAGVGEEDVRGARHRLGVRPRAKVIDTLAGEWPARTNYRYMTYEAVEDEADQPGDGKRVLVLGAGVFRIGVSVEFDWGVVEFLEEAKRMGYEVVVMNYNPETVSTDWDVAGKLYFEELTPESVHEVVCKEGGPVVVAFLGGQITNNMVEKLEGMGVSLAGVRGDAVGLVERRDRFHSLLERMGVKQPEWVEVVDVGDALRFADSVGYPVLVRPSYVLSGAGARVVASRRELENALSEAYKVGRGKPVVVSKFLLGALEAEVDAVSDSKRVICLSSEHVEPAGVHSGDSTVVTPPYSLDESTVREMRRVAHMIAVELGVRGPLNVQFLIWRGGVYVLEANLRMSRSMPFVSKARGVNLASLSARVSLDPGYRLQTTGEVWEPDRIVWGVKSPQFSWPQFRGAYPCLGPEMKSTGEVAAVSRRLKTAVLTSWLAAQPRRLDKGKTVIAYPASQTDRGFIAEAAEKLSEAGFNVVTLLDSPLDGFKPLGRREALRLLDDGRVTLLVSSGCNPGLDYEIRRRAADLLTPMILDGRLGAFVSSCLADEGIIDTSLAGLGERVNILTRG